jgi:malate permease and related proteins
MLNELMAIMAPTLTGTFLGWVWAKRDWPFPTDFVTQMVMLIGTPCLIVSAINKISLPASSFAWSALAFALVMLSMGLLGSLYLKLTRMSLSAFLPTLIFPNTGNMGLPICLFAFGQNGLALALGSFMAMLMAQFTVGLMIVAPQQSDWRQRSLELLRQPVVISMLVSVSLLITGAHLPKWLANSCELLGGLAIPLMTIALGVSLAKFKLDHVKQALGLSLLRIGLGALLGYAIGTALKLDALSLKVLILQSAMPMAVMNYMLALKYQHHPDQVAAAVLLSTLLGFVAIPSLIVWLTGV